MVKGDFVRSAAIELWRYGNMELRCKLVRGVYGSYIIYYYMSARQVYIGDRMVFPHSRVSVANEWDLWYKLTSAWMAYRHAFRGVFTYYIHTRSHNRGWRPQRVNTLCHQILCLWGSQWPEAMKFDKNSFLNNCREICYAERYENNVITEQIWAQTP